MYHSDRQVSPAPPSAIRDQAGNIGYAANDVYVGIADCVDLTNNTYAYDEAGCLTNLNGTSLEWDERYRLTFAVQDSVFDIQYSYDVYGRKMSRTSGSDTEYYVYDGLHIVADLDEDKNLLRTYSYGPGVDNLLCFTDHTTSNTYYAVKDHQNTVLALVDEFGTVVESYEYTAYGETTAFDASGTELTESAIGNRYTFQGRETDWATGLIYFRARWYDSDFGRWISKDPLGISGGLNLYEFCRSNPVNFIDPGGLVTEKIDGYVIRVHNVDVDPWPSKPHGHILNSSSGKLTLNAKGQIIQGTKSSHKIVGKLSKSGLKTWAKTLGKIAGKTLGFLTFFLDPCTAEGDIEHSPGAVFNEDGTWTWSIGSALKTE